MRIAVPHHTSRTSARKIIEKRLGDLMRQFGHTAKDVEHHWSGDVMSFAFKAKGFSGKGTIEITEDDVIIDGKLPLLAKPFEPRIRNTVEREAESMFRTA